MQRSLRSTIPGSAALLLGVIAGCPPPRGDLGMYTETAATTSTAAATDPPGTQGDGPVTTTQAPGDTTAADPNPDATSTSTGTTTPPFDTTTGVDTTTGPDTTDTTDTTATTTTGGPALSCEPEAADPIVGTGIAWDPFPDIVDGKIDFSAECTSLGAVVGWPHLLELQCGAVKASIVMYSDASELIALPDDHPLQLKYAYRAASFSASEWFTVVDPATDPPALLLAGFTSPWITPPDIPDFFAPIGVTPLDDVCLAPPACPFPFERLGARFTHGDSELLLTDNTSGHFGDGVDFRVLLGYARHYLEEFDFSNRGCPHSTDQAEIYFAGVILRQP